MEEVTKGSSDSKNSINQKGLINHGNFGEQHYVYITKMTGPYKGMVGKETGTMSKNHQWQGLLVYA